MFSSFVSLLNVERGKNSSSFPLKEDPTKKKQKASCDKEQRAGKKFPEKIEVPCHHVKGEEEKTDVNINRISPYKPKDDETKYF